MMLPEICSEELCDGREVHIEGLGYFIPILQSTQKVTRTTKNKSLKIRLKTIGCHPDVRLKEEMIGAKVKLTKYSRHSESLSEIEIEIRLKEYFVKYGVMLCYDFQELCILTRTTANRHLRRLQDEEKFKNVGRRNQLMYVPVASHYGMSYEDVMRR